MKKQVLSLALVSAVIGSITTGCSYSKSGSANDTTMNYKVKVKITTSRNTIKKDTMKKDTTHH